VERWAVKLFEEAARMEADNRPFAMATIVTSRGSTPRSRGRMLIRSDGSSLGSVGGGAMERIVLEEALAALQEGTSRTVIRDLVEQGERAAGMDCGGRMEVYIDVVGKLPTLVLVGGGHVNLAVARAAAHLDFSIEVVESRREFAGSDRFPMARSILSGADTISAVQSAVVDGDTAVVIATASEDLEVLRSVLKTPAGYIGFLGSKRKVSKLIRNLQEEGVSRRDLARVHAPIGLDIGAETPAEIAVSILGEILAFRSGRSGSPLRRMVDQLAVIRGAGDMATGVAVRLFRAGFPVVCLETPRPTVIRRTVSFAQAMYDGTVTVEGVTAVRAEGLDDVYRALEEGEVPLLADPECRSLETLKPAVVVDAIIAKKNLGTRRDMAPVTVALGPGFVAGGDVDAVVETNRGHTLGKVILDGPAQADTGVPGTIGGESARRVVRAPAGGVFTAVAAIGDLVQEGAVLGHVGETAVPSPLTGLVRGLLADGLEVTHGFKIGDVDPRGESVDWRTVSDKARAVAGGVLEAILYLQHTRRR
jgi:xanthine dehydrogenase accessory factor